MKELDDGEGRKRTREVARRVIRWESGKHPSSSTSVPPSVEADEEGCVS